MLGSTARSTAVWAVALLLILPATGLQTSPGSPCADVCHQKSTNTTGSEVVCLDQQFKEMGAGARFQQCVECQLRSTHTDLSSGQSDVDWGLFNLRYAFTSCVYGYPGSVNNVSTPCTVSCQTLDSALEYELDDPSGVNFDTWCGASSFADNIIDQCEFCYNLTTNQVYMANFLESLRYNCHFHTPRDSAFPINPTRIFSQSLLPSSTADLINGTQKSGSGISNLAIVIALPILGFIILLCSLAVACFFCIRWRRRKAREHRMSGSGHLHARWNDTTISTPAQGWAHPQQQVFSPGGQYPPQAGYGPGFHFVDGDGKQQDVGYSKAHYATVSEEPVSVPVPAPYATYSPEREKGQEFPSPYVGYQQPQGQQGQHQYPPPQ